MITALLGAAVAAAGFRQLLDYNPGQHRQRHLTDLHHLVHFQDLEKSSTVVGADGGAGAGRLGGDCLLVVVVVVVVGAGVGAGVCSDSIVAAKHKVSFTAAQPPASHSYLTRLPNLVPAHLRELWIFCVDSFDSRCADSLDMNLPV